MKKIKAGKERKTKAHDSFLKHSKEGSLHHTREDLRWATHEIVGDYRAERLACDTIADIGCGIGFQALSFAKTCKKVIAVEIDKQKIDLARKNAAKLKIKNIEFIHGDALDDEVIKKLEGNGVDIVFCDPERKPEETERTVDSITPDMKIFLKKYKKLTPCIAIEFPPQIREIPFDCEKEYLSLNGKLNRLTIYFGKLKKCESSAVILPQKKILQSKKDSKIIEPVDSGELKAHLYEADPAVVKAGLLAELAEETGASFYEENKQAFMTSEEDIKSDFFRSKYFVIDSCEFDEREIISKLRKNDAGKVLIRFSVDPKQYWSIRNRYEHELIGKEELCVFKLKGKAVIAKTILD